MLILLLATALIPFQLTVIPTFVIFHDIGLINTLGALIVPQLTSALGIYLMYSFFQSFPRELEEAGRIDGCSRLQVFWKIVLAARRSRPWPPSGSSRSSTRGTTCSGR